MKSEKYKPKPPNLNRKFALISREFTQEDFHDELSGIIEVANTVGATHLIFALHTMDLKRLQKESFRNYFIKDPSINSKTVVLEYSDLHNIKDHMMSYKLNRTNFRSFYQWFGKSTDHEYLKEAMVADLPSRIINNDECIIVCGEISALIVKHHNRTIEDRFNILEWLTSKNIKVIINQTHDLMCRYEMTDKRLAFSRNERLVLSVWNSNKKKRNAKVPWGAYYDNKNITNRVREIPTPQLRNDIRIGVIDFEEVMNG